MHACPDGPVLADPHRCGGGACARDGGIIKSVDVALAKSSGRHYAHDMNGKRFANGRSATNPREMA